MGMLLFLAVAAVCAWAGVKMVADAVRQPAAPPIPTARVANPDAGEQTTRAASRAASKLGRVVVVIVGLAIIVAPWYVGFLFASTIATR